MKLKQILIAAVLSCVLPGSLLGAKPSGLDGPTLAPEVFSFQNPVEKVQEILKNLGFYNGPVDGTLNDALVLGIQRYQSRHGLAPSGEVTDGLIDHLENIGRVRVLLQRLDEVRTRKQQEARAALLSNPKTRALVAGSQAVQQVDPTRDKNACLKDPNAQCLLREAVESSRAVFEDDLRDWALGEILAAQVQAGMSEKALDTAARIQDTRLVVSALATIAITQAKAGQVEEALSGLDLIPLVDRKISVLLEIARIQFETNQSSKARATLQWVRRELAGLDGAEERFTTEIERLKVLALLDNQEAIQDLTQVMDQIRGQLDTDAKLILLRQSASAMADFKNPEFALKTLEDLPDDESRIPVLMAATRAFLDMERFQAAQTTLERISQDRYRSVVLSDLTLAQWQVGDKGPAQSSLDNALLLAQNIKLPFARNYALSRAADTLREMSALSGEPSFAHQAYEILDQISDDRIKARGLWQLSHVLEVHNMALRTDLEMDRVVQQAFDAIPSRFSRAWILGDLAAAHIEQGETSKATQALDRALRVAGELTNPWARARVFAKLGAVLSRLD